MATSSSPRSPRCTNTSNPSVLVAAGLVARKARALGLDSKPWVKTSLAPGSQVVTDYLDRAGLTEDLNAIGFDLVGYGCTTCIGNSGPLPEAISASIHKNDLVAASVLSGNRNFEGRVSPDVRANYLASPPLVVAYALKGTVIEDMVATPIGQDQDGNDVYPQGHLADSNDEVRALIDQFVNGDMFRARYADVYKGDARWQGIAVDRRRHLRLAGRLHLHRQPALFRGHDDDAGAAVRHRRRAPARDPRRFDHHRPHQPRRRDQARQPGRQIPVRASGQPAPTSTPTAPAAAITK